MIEKEPFDWFSTESLLSSGNDAKEPASEIKFFTLPEMFPWIEFSETALESLPETIDTIWPLNLLSQSFRGLLSLLDKDPNRRMTDLTGPSGYRTRSDPNARMRELIYEDFQSGPPGYDTQADPKKKRGDDKPSHISPERVHGGIQ